MHQQSACTFIKRFKKVCPELIKKWFLIKNMRCSSTAIVLYSIFWQRGSINILFILWSLPIIVILFYQWRSWRACGGRLRWRCGWPWPCWASRCGAAISWGGRRRCWTSPHFPSPGPAPAPSGTWPAGARPLERTANWPSAPPTAPRSAAGRPRRAGCTPAPDTASAACPSLRPPRLPPTSHRRPTALSKVNIIFPYQLFLPFVFFAKHLAIFLLHVKPFFINYLLLNFWF